MDCPAWVWNILLRRHWPREFLHDRVAQGVEWCEENCSDLPISDAKPIFIFAAGWRSGSTLLQRLLNSNSEVMIWGEAYEHALPLYHLAAPLAGLTKQPLDLNFMSRHLARMPGELTATVTTKWIANLTPPPNDLKRAHLAFMDTLFATKAMEAKRPRWGLKMVRSDATVARYLKWLYPEAKILYMFRDPYASYRSYLNATQSGWYLYYPNYRVKGTLPFMVHWRHCMDSFRASEAEVSAFPVQFESLASGQLLDRLQEYLGFQVDPAVLNLKVDYAHDKTRGLSASDRRIIRFIGGEVAKTYGYTGDGS